MQQKRLEARFNQLLSIARPGHQARDPQASAIFEVPQALKERLQAISTVRLRIQGLDGPIPLRRWLDAFAIQFQEVTLYRVSTLEIRTYFTRPGQNVSRLGHILAPDEEHMDLTEHTSGC